MAWLSITPNSSTACKAVSNAYSYVISKHAGVGMMRANCQDLAGRGVHTANICPGFTDTEMLRKHLAGDEALIDHITQAVTFGRLISPEEITSLLLFCAGNPVLNGSVLQANLGQIER
jgi:3-oxoacyl-[acyl-carrier protein] reductase